MTPLNQTFPQIAETATFSVDLALYNYGGGRKRRRWGRCQLGWTDIESGRIINELIVATIRKKKKRDLYIINL